MLGAFGAQLIILYLLRFEGYSRTVFAIYAILLAIIMTASLSFGDIAMRFGLALAIFTLLAPAAYADIEIAMVAPMTGSDASHGEQLRDGGCRHSPVRRREDSQRAAVDGSPRQPGVAEGELHPLDRQAESIGRDLRHRRPGARSHIA